MSAPDRPARPRIVVTRRLPEPVEQRMAELFEVQLNSTDAPLDRELLLKRAAGCDVLVPTLTDRVDAALIADLPDCVRMIANFGTGVDHIDLAAASARGIIVSNTPGVLTEDTADITLALILSVPRRLAEGESVLRAGNWAGWGPTVMLGHRIGGKQLGILGMGRIGKAVARRARAFGLSIAYHNRHRLPVDVEAELGARYVASVDELLSGSDIVTIHCPLTSTTRGLINADRIAKMKPSAALINTARGEVVDEEALIDALTHGRIAGAGLDVYAHEPAVDPRLVALPNVMLLPHLGSATVEGRIAMGNKVITNIRAWVDGHRPPDQILDGWL